VDDFRLSTAMTLAKGAKLVLWFTTYGSQPLPAERLGWGLLSRDDLAQEVKRWAGWIHQYGGMFARLEARPSRRVAVLLSEANRVGQIHQYNNPLMFDRFYPAMRIGGLPVDLITDEAVLDGTLSRYEALCLFQFQYTTQSLWKKISAFAGTPGKVVVCDQASAPALRPAGAITLSVNVMQDLPVQTGKSWMQTIVDTVAANAVVAREQIASKLKPDDLQLSGSKLVAPHWLYGGEGRLLALVNYNLYGPESVNVSLQNIGGAVYDLLGRDVVVEAAPGALLSWRAENIGKADWRLYMLLPQKIGGIAVKARLAANDFVVDAEIQGSDGKPVKAAIPVHVEFIGPDGKTVVPYDTYTASDPISGKVHTTAARAKLMDPAGTWQVKVTELLSGKSKTVKIRLSE
jgi:hypothetical protein